MANKYDKKKKFLAMNSRMSKGRVGEEIRPRGQNFTVGNEIHKK